VWIKFSLNFNALRFTGKDSGKDLHKPMWCNGPEPPDVVLCKAFLEALLSELHDWTRIFVVFV
jgi:hypothetical protein